MPKPSVRDALLGLANKDFDIEVFGVSYERLAQTLARWGRTDLVGRLHSDRCNPHRLSQLVESNSWFRQIEA
jgi:hypothetical protein